MSGDCAHNPGQDAETTGTVVALDGEFAVVRVESVGCGRCHEEGGCGGNPLHRLSGPAARDFRVRNPGSARVGQSVVVVTPAGAIRRSATAAYVWPLAALLAAALAGSALAGEAGAILGALFGVAAGWLILRGSERTRTGERGLEPYIRA